VEASHLIEYDLTIDVATWTTPEHCSPGSVALSTAIEERWPILLVREGAYGCYNRRPSAGGGKSIHGDGRAIDIGVGWTPTPELLAAAHECTEWLAVHARFLGVQRIIYNHRIWDRNGWRYFAPNDHQDHAHVEQTYEAGWSNPLPLDQARVVITPPPPPPIEDDLMAPIYFRNSQGWVKSFDPYSGRSRVVTGQEFYDLLGKVLTDAKLVTDAVFNALV
jgi:hypothetical protein